MEEEKKTLERKNPLTEEEKKAAHEKYQDKELTCERCGAKFVFSAETQYWFFDKKHYKPDGVTEVAFVQPKLCDSCRAKHKADLRTIRNAKRAGKTVTYDGKTVTIGDAPASVTPTATLYAPDATIDAKKA